jgi:hypothetical protein
MENGQNIESAPRRKRGRPPSLHVPGSPALTKESERQERPEKRAAATSSMKMQVSCERETTYIAQQGLSVPTKQYSDRSELLRVAHELDVSENSIYRWMSGNTEPRIHHLKRLPEVLPAHQEKLTAAINKTFHGILRLPVRTLETTINEVPRDIYRRVIELVVMTDDDDIRLWEVSQALFDHALRHLDTERRGMAITYAHLLPRHEDGYIHALREMAMRGNEPWPFVLKSRAYLGSTSMAGATATLRRMQAWNENESENRSQVEVDEYERSACAAPVVRGRRIAGTLIVSSTDADFFRHSMACQAVEEYAQLLALALHERDFQPFSALRLRPMPGLAWQRAELMQNYVPRIIAYARQHQSSRQEAERIVEREMELEFEKVGQEQQRSQAKQNGSVFSF